MVIKSKQQIKKRVERTFLAKDKNAFQAELLNFSRTFFPEKIRDLSENSVGGMFLEYASFIGDTMSFYLDHQFHELSPETAVETRNIQRHLKNAGVKITGASPAAVDVSFTIIINAVKVGSRYEPRTTDIPKLKEGTIVLASNGTRFELTEDLDFSKKDNAGNFLAELEIASTDTDGSPSSFFMTRTGLCVSGFRETETFNIPNTHTPFRTITLSNEDASQIINVFDSEGNKYYEVEALSQDTVFRVIENENSDNFLVDNNIELIPAPRRFTTDMNINTRLTTLRFGSGLAESLDDDIVSDPSEFAIPLFGKKNFGRFSLDPGKLLDTQTLGISPINTSITVDYRFGGGLSHNVAEGAITSLDTLLIEFPGEPTSVSANSIRASLNVNNPGRASGGEDAPTLRELKEKITSFRNSQSRIVSKEDLLARVYTMPSGLGRVFRASVRTNPNNPLAAQLFIISRDQNRKLINSPDSLKKNLIVYLNQFRLISDAIDILDAKVVNLGVEFTISTELSANRNLVLQNVIRKLKDFFQIKNWQIDQPIILGDIENIIFNTQGVQSVIGLKFKNIVGNVLGREYSQNIFNVNSNTKKGMIIPDTGSIFEIKFPNVDIEGSSV